MAALGAITADLGVGTGFSGFTSADVVALVDVVVASVADNPGLMTLNVGGDPALTAALVAMLKTLKQQNVMALSAGDVVAIVTAGLAASARKLPLLQQAETTIPLLIDSLFQTVFAALATIRQAGGAAAWQISGRGFIRDLVKAALGAVVALPADNQVTAARLRAAQAAIVDFLTAGKSITALPDAIRQALGS